MKIEISYDPSNRSKPLHIQLPEGTNPILAAVLLSQCVTMLVSNFGGFNSLIVPAANLPKIS